MTLLHRIAHLLRWNTGKVVSWTHGGRTVIAFRCSGCGRVQDAFSPNIDAVVAKETP
jgi:hypothetical protein